jgi:hypothetical protein
VLIQPFTVDCNNHRDAVAGFVEEQGAGGSSCRGQGSRGTRGTRGTREQGASEQGASEQGASEQGAGGQGGQGSRGTSGYITQSLIPNP